MIGNVVLRDDSTLSITPISRFGIAIGTKLLLLRLILNPVRSPKLSITLAKIFKEVGCASVKIIVSSAYWIVRGGTTIGECISRMELLTNHFNESVTNIKKHW